MNKIHVICEKNEKTNLMEIKKIVILEDGMLPKIIDYKSPLDLLQIIEFSEKKGYSIENGIDSVLENKFLNITLSSKEKDISEIKTEILESQITVKANEQLNFSNENEKQEEQVLDEPEKEQDVKEEEQVIDEAENKTTEESSKIDIRQLPTEEIDSKENEDKKENGIRIRLTSKVKKFFKRAGAFVLTAATIIFGHELIAKFTNKKTVPTNNIKVEKSQNKTVQKPSVNPTVNPTVKPSLNPNKVQEVKPVEINYQKEINEFFTKNNTKMSTVDFIQSNKVLNFLTNYKNKDQLREVLSALAYGYEVNILNTKAGNFRLNEDNENILHSFTKDFMCAKALVNNYDSEKLLKLTGGSDITYEELINGFKNYCHTLRTYGMNAKERLPFNYLTNNDPESTRLMNELFDLLINVNRNRDNGTLTSKHTDDFIAKTFNIFIENNQSTNISEASKTVLASMVDSFVAMQSNVNNGKALYLQEDRGYAKAGINLQEINGQFEFRNKDKTTYSFTSLFDVMNHEYGRINDICEKEQKRMISNIINMRNVGITTSQEAKNEFVSALYRNSYGILADEFLQNKITYPEIVEKIRTNPLMNDAIMKYENSFRGSSIDTSNLVSFRNTYNNIDILLGINGKTNPYNNLINIRRTFALNSKYNGYNTVRSSGIPSYNQTTKTTKTNKTTKTTKTEVSYEDLSKVEQQKVNKMIADLKAKENNQKQEQERKVEQAKEDLRKGVESGKSQAELAKIAAEKGIELDPNYQKNMEAALRAQQEAEAKRIAEEQRIAAENAERARIAAENAKKEEEEQKRRKEEEDRLINGQVEEVLETSTPTVEPTSTPVITPAPTSEIDNQLDPDFSTGDEQDYTPSAKKQELMHLKDLLGHVKVDTKGLVRRRA